MVHLNQKNGKIKPVVIYEIGLYERKLFKFGMTFCSFLLKRSSISNLIYWFVYKLNVKCECSVNRCFRAKIQLVQRTSSKSRGQPEQIMVRKSLNLKSS